MRPPCPNVPPCDEVPCAHCERVMEVMEALDREVRDWADANVIGQLEVSDQTADMVLQAAQAIDPSFVAAECFTDEDGANSIMLTRRDFTNAVRIARESEPQ